MGFDKRLSFGVKELALIDLSREKQMIVASYKPGMPCWADLISADMEKSSAFYSGLFGWVVPEGDEAFGGYRNATLKGLSVAGMMPKMDPEQFAVWSTYVEVTDADATLAKVESLGGSAMFPIIDVGDLGRMGVFIDPFGTVFGVWQPAIHTGAQIYGEPGAMNWIELTTDNIDGSKAFYSDVFGWSVGGSDTYVEFGVDGDMVAGMMPKPEAMSAMPNFWGVYFSVENADEAVAKVAALGGTVYMPPTTIEAGTFAVIADSNGTMFNIIQTA
jgi:uncharacterized protein